MINDEKLADNMVKESCGMYDMLKSIVDSNALNQQNIQRELHVIDRLRVAADAGGLPATST